MLFSFNIPTISDLHDVLPTVTGISVALGIETEQRVQNVVPAAVVSSCSQDVAETLYSMKEVSQHCEPSSCWCVIENVVYDLTDFLYEHPGGMDIILEHAGRDCTTAFEEKGHSKWAFQMLSKYRIGMLVLDERITL